MPRLRWYQGWNRYQWTVFAVAAAAWFFDCTDQRIFMLARSPALSQLMGLPQGHHRIVDYATYATAATMAGWAVGGLIFGVLGDRWGRARTLSLSVLVYSAFTGLCGLATGGLDFCVYRFLMGAGIGGAFATAATLIAEVLPDHARAFSLGLFSALSVIGNMTGSAAAAWVFLPERTFCSGLFGLGGIAGWRLLFFLGALPALLIVLIMRTVKESPQWQAARQTAREDLNRQLGDLGSVFRTPWLRRRMIVAVGLATAGIVGVWGVGFWSPELINDALTPPEFRGHLAPAEIAEHIGKVRAIGPLIQDIGGFLGILTFAALASRVPRRTSFAAAFVTSMLAVAYTFLTLRVEWQVYVLLPVLGFCTLSVMGGFVIYFPELYPTRLRSTGVALGYNLARLSAAAVMLLGNPIRQYLADAGVADPFRWAAIVLAGVYVMGLLFLLPAPETRGLPLPEE